MKKILIVCLLSLCAAVTASAETRNDKAVWHKRATYLNLGYVRQDLSGDMIPGTVSSDLGGSLSWGRTFYLHKKPIGNFLKFGLDWSWLDLNAARYAPAGMENDVYQLDAAMQIGPSLTVNPVGRLKLSAYARVAPTYSAMWLNETLAHGFTAHYNYGATLAWRMISVGVEFRNGFKDAFEYKVIDVEKALEGMEEGGNLSLSATGKASLANANTIRFFFGFRF